MTWLIKKITCSCVLKYLMRKEHIPILLLLLFCHSLIPRTTYASSCYYAETMNYCPTYKACVDYIGPLPSWCEMTVTAYGDGSGGRIDVGCWEGNTEGCPCCAAGTQNSEGECLYWATTCGFGVSPQDPCRNIPKGSYKKDGILYCCPGSVDPCCTNPNNICCTKPDDPSCTCPIQTGSGSAGNSAAGGDSTSGNAVAGGTNN